jgi:methionine synthase I (cobalamin-dependent)
MRNTDFSFVSAPRSATTGPVPATDRFRDALGRGAILLDAAMGTRLIAAGLDLATEDPSAWSLDRPETVLDIHRRDLAAGSDAILTNTFGANRAWLARYGLADRAPEINREAARLARLAAGPDRLVLGSIGPTASGDPDALREQSDALTHGGVDALILETHRLDQALAALGSLASPASLPILASLYQWPEPIPRAARALAEAGASAIGVNCVTGMEQVVRIARELHDGCDRPLLIKPSPGGASPAQFARAIPDLLDLGVRLIGGCCGSDETYIAAMKRRLSNARTPRSDAGRTGS